MYKSMNEYPIPFYDSFTDPMLEMAIEDRRGISVQTKAMDLYMLKF